MLVVEVVVVVVLAGGVDFCNMIPSTSLTLGS